jgi:hypothetical protein
MIQPGNKGDCEIFFNGKLGKSAALCSRPLARGTTEANVQLLA